MQYVDTQLPSNSGSNQVSVFCKCFDSSGRNKMKFLQVDLAEPHREYEFEVNDAHRLSDLLIYFDYIKTTGKGSPAEFLRLALLKVTSRQSLSQDEHLQMAMTLAGFPFYNQTDAQIAAKVLSELLH